MSLTYFHQKTGSVLLATMIFVVAIAAFLTSYLILLQNGNHLVARAQEWNAALPIAEAGIEEGMANLNQVAITTDPTAVSFSPLSHDLIHGTYFVSSSAAGVVSTITSTGVVSAPISSQKISRAVRVTAQRVALFSKGMVSMTNIRMNGNNIASDSWNSHDPAQSVNGQWNGFSGTNGDVAAVDGYVDIGNHTISGDLYLGPNSIFKKGTVTGTVYTDWNIQFPDAALPTTNAMGDELPSIWVEAPLESNSHTFTNSGYYTIRDSYPITNAPGVTVYLDVKVSNYQPTGLTIKGGTTNAGTVVMYQESGTLTLSGGSSGGAINNRPENFVYFGLPGVTTITFGGDSDFVGTIYAPQADLTLNGGGSAQNFIGSVIVKSVTMNGHYLFHYDTSLVGLYYGYYVVSSWAEL